MDYLTAPIAHEHDIFFRTALSDLSVARELFEMYLPEAILESIDLSTLEQQPTSFINELRQESIMDLLYKVHQTHPEGDCYLILEHQSTPDPLMPLRISQYSDHVIQYHLDKSKENQIPMLFSLVIYHGVDKHCCSTELRDLVNTGAEAVQYFKDFKIINLRQMKDQELNLNTRVGVMGYVLKHIYDRDIYRYIQEIINNLQLLVHSGYGNHVSLVLQYAVIRGETADQEALIELVTKRISQNLGGIIMNLADRMMNEGLQKGLEKGLQEGLREGIQVGHFEEKLAVAKRSLAAGSDPAFVAKITGLSLEKVLTLAALNEH